MSDLNLAEVLVSLVRNVSGPLETLITLVCWIAALLVLIAGGLRLVRRGDGRGRAGSGTGTALTLVTSGVLFLFPHLLGAAGKSLFGFVPAEGTAVLAYGKGTETHGELLWAVFEIIRFMGAFAFLKSWFVLRDAGDGTGGATASQGFAHMIGGIGGFYIVPLVDVMQNTLGVAPLRISGLVGGES